MYDRFGKRLLDLVLATVGLIVLAPFLVVIALLIRFPLAERERGPVFYRGRRVGRHGKAFAMFKFRTMVTDADRLGPSSTSADDPRLTGLGAGLRRYKLDELPQLLNVLRGEMSFVGPRPEVRKFTDRYTEEERAILDVRPGITDWASLSCPDEEDVLATCADRYADADEAYAAVIRPQKLRLQLAYVARHDLWTDLKIISRTVVAVLRKAAGRTTEVVVPEESAHGS